MNIQVFSYLTLTVHGAASLICTCDRLLITGRICQGKEILLQAQYMSPAIISGVKCSVTGSYFY